MSRRRERGRTDDEKRTKSARVPMSPAEMRAVDEAVERTSYSRGAWIWMAIEAELGRGPGPGAETERGALVSEVIRSRTALDRIGRNLNQLTAAMNATGDVSQPQLDAVLQRVDDAVRRVDEATAVVTDRRGGSWR